MDDLERQYVFVGVSHFEYLKYWYRQDLPKNMWKWSLASGVKATAGFTAVSKKGRRSAAETPDGLPCELYDV